MKEKSPAPAGQTYSVLVGTSTSLSEQQLDMKPVTIVKMVEGWFQMIGLDQELLIYCNERSSTPYLGSFRGHHFYSNFIITKIDRYGKFMSLSSEEILSLTTEILSSRIHQQHTVH